MNRPNNIIDLSSSIIAHIKWKIPDESRRTRCTEKKQGNRRKSVRCSAVPIAPMSVFADVPTLEGQWPQTGQ